MSTNIEVTVETTNSITLDIAPFDTTQANAIQIRGKSVTTTAPTSGQAIVYNGTDYAPRTIPLLDAAQTFTANQTGPYINTGAGRFDVRAYGAVGNGSTLDTAAILAAAAAASTFGGGVVELIPRANHAISTLDFTQSNFEMDCRGAILTQAAGASQRIRFGTSSALVDGVYLYHLEVDGSAATGGFGIQLWVVSRCLVESVTLVGATAITGYTGIQLNGDSSTRGSFAVRDCRVEDAGAHGIQLNTTLVGGLVEGCTVLNSCASGTTGAAIYMRAVEGVARGNIVRTANDNGIRCSGTGTKVVGNYVELADVDGIRLEGASQEAIGNRITDNLGGGGAGNGIRVTGLAGGNVNARVIGNQVDGCSNGIHVDDDSVTVDNCVVQGNVCNGNTNGIAVNGLRHTIIGNVCKNNAGIGIQGSDATFVTCAGNNLYDDQGTKTQTYGIRTTGTSDFWVVTSNIARAADHLTAGISLAGSNNVSADNI